MLVLGRGQRPATVCPHTQCPLVAPPLPLPCELCEYVYVFGGHVCVCVKPGMAHRFHRPSYGARYAWLNRLSAGVDRWLSPTCSSRRATPLASRCLHSEALLRMML